MALKVNDILIMTDTCYFLGQKVVAVKITSEGKFTPMINYRFPKIDIREFCLSELHYKSVRAPEIINRFYENEFTNR